MIGRTILVHRPHREPQQIQIIVLGHLVGPTDLCLGDFVLQQKVYHIIVLVLVRSVSSCAHNVEIHKPAEVHVIASRSR